MQQAPGSRGSTPRKSHAHDWAAMLVFFTVPRRFHLRPSLFGLLAMLLLGGIAVPARALERVTLRNGFFYDCLRHETLDSTHVRLFLSGENTVSGYVDLPTAEVVSTDTLPAPPPTPHVASAPASPATSPKADIPNLIVSAGANHNIDVALLSSIVHAESSGRARAVSRTGAQGLMQLMPSTAHEMGVTNSFEPGQNINGGTAYLDSLLTRFHDNLALALAAYNAGPGAVDRYHGIPPYRETRAYVVRVMTEFKRRKEASEGASQVARR
jgi:hypothetical protein